MPLEPPEITGARINARKWAEEIFELAHEQSLLVHVDFKPAFWTLIAYRIAEASGTINDYPPPPKLIPTPSRPQKVPMTSPEKRVFEQGRIPFQTNQGDKLIGEVDERFLFWLLKRHTDERRWFDQLERYLDL